jgi:hypothetical protein
VVKVGEEAGSVPADCIRVPVVHNSSERDWSQALWRRV